MIINQLYILRMQIKKQLDGFLLSERCNLSFIVWAKLSIALAELHTSTSRGKIIRLFLLILVLSTSNSFLFGSQLDTTTSDNPIIVDKDYCKYVKDSQLLGNHKVYLAIFDDRDTACLYNFIIKYQKKITRINDQIDYDFYRKGFVFESLVLFTNLRAQYVKQRKPHCQISKYTFLMNSPKISALLLDINCEDDLQLVQKLNNLWTLRIYNNRGVVYPENFKLKSDSLTELYLEGFAVDSNSIKWIDSLENLDEIHIDDFVYADRGKVFNSDKVRLDLDEIKKTRIRKRYYIRKYQKSKR